MISSPAAALSAEEFPTECFVAALETRFHLDATVATYPVMGSIATAEVYDASAGREWGGYRARPADERP